MNLQSVALKNSQHPDNDFLTSTPIEVSCILQGFFFPVLATLTMNS